jgi:adenine phosphoribosyltransferase
VCAAPFNAIFGPEMSEQEIKEFIRIVPDFPKKGISFKDITPLLQSAETCGRIQQMIFDEFSGEIDAVAGIESRGFFFGFGVAQSLGIPFIPIRKKGKLPHKTISVRYGLEYGFDEVEMHLDAIQKGQRVLVHDDLLATGGTAAAAAELVKVAGGELAGFSFLIHLSFLEGMEKVSQHSNRIHCLTHYND